MGGEEHAEVPSKNPYRLPNKDGYATDESQVLKKMIFV